MGKALVAVLRTKPATVIDDYARLMDLARYREAVPVGPDIALKINISWHTFYPACSTAPWQLDGVVHKLLADGYSREKIHGCHNDTVVVSAKKGEVRNRQKAVLDKHGLANVHLYEDPNWVRYEPKAKLRVLNEIYPQGVHIPKRLIGESVIHLPTVKTHVFTKMTGAMKNAFGGLLHRRRHWTHSVIHETLVDLLHIQKEIHPGLFAVMDGTWAGDGPGPRCMRIHEKNVILASADQVAIDAVAARMMGLDPLADVPCIRMAHEDGLGVGDPRDIEIAGDADATQENWRFDTGSDTFASRGQKLIYWGPLKPLEKFLLRTALAPWSYAASILYHDFYWYPLIGRRRVQEALKGPWGKLFESYGGPPSGAESAALPAAAG
jgi:uncharacterized protein (DUF362 family)